MHPCPRLAPGARGSGRRALFLEVPEGFEQLALELEAARSSYEQVKAFDAALFERDYEA